MSEAAAAEQPSVDDGDDVELTEEEIEELKRQAAHKASKDLLAAARANDSSAAMACLQVPGVRIDLTEINGGSVWTPLHYAALNGDAPLVDGLLAAGAAGAYTQAVEKKSKRELQALQAAIQGAPPRDAHESFEEEEDPATFINTPLLWSCFKGWMPTTLSLLDAGYSLADVDTVGNTALHLGGASKVLPVVELLLASGADPSARNRYLLTPLDVATTEPIRDALRSAMRQQGRVPPAYTPQQEAAARQKREAERKAQSLQLRSIAGALSEILSRPVPSSLEEEADRVAELEKAKAAAEGTNGVVDGAVIAEAGTQIQRLELSSAMRLHLSATVEQHPIITQAAYVGFVNKLERYAKVAERQGCNPNLVASARATVARSFSEFWLFKIEEELKGVECASLDLEPRLDLLEARIEAATAAEASESLILSASKVLERFRSEVALAIELDDKQPPYKLPPAEADTEELNKKDLAKFMAEYWTPDDSGYIKETTEEEGCQPFPLPPGFNKAEDDEEWAANPMKALINTPEGYIWVPSKALIGLREYARELDVALVRATNSASFAPLCERARERLLAIETDIQQLEVKDETDMTTAEALASKNSKKMKAALTKKKK